MVDDDTNSVKKLCVDCESAEHTDDDARASASSVVTPLGNDAVQNIPFHPVPPAAAVAAPPAVLRAEVKNIVSAVNHRSELKLDKEEGPLLEFLLHQVGRANYGIGASETYLWLNPRLEPVGWYVDPEIISNAAEPEDRERLESKPTQAVPNIDLVGALWSMSARSYDEGAEQTHAKNARRDVRRKLHSQLSDHHRSAVLEWRDLKSVIYDPYQSHGPRTESMYKAGLGMATGITFYVFGIWGIVIWYAKADVDTKLLKDPRHETYMRRLSHLKGALLASVDARRKCVGMLDQSSELELPLDGTGDTEPEWQEGSTTFTAIHCDDVRKSFIVWLKKIRGGGAQIPTCMSWIETVFTLIGSFLGLLVIGILHKAVRVLTEEEYVLILGPFAAIVMLQFGMPGSPAGQPRTILWGQLIAGIIAVSLSYIPDDKLPIWLRTIIAATLAIGVMMKLGVGCPPAAANSLLYARHRYSWKMLGITILCSCISFIPAIAFNNLNVKRQYPTFWGLKQERDAVKAIRRRRAEKTRAGAC